MILLFLNAVVAWRRFQFNRTTRKLAYPKSYGHFLELLVEKRERLQALGIAEYARNNWRAP